jgi:adenylylsulfate reductase subunit B
LSLLVERGLCVSCGACAEVCPGGLLEPGAGGAIQIPRPEDCWGCCACLKACPSGALSIALPPALGGRGGRLSCRYEKGALLWVYRDPKGAVTEIDGGGGGGGY